MARIDPPGDAGRTEGIEESGGNGESSNFSLTLPKEAQLEIRAEQNKGNKRLLDHALNQIISIQNRRT